jgi:hypothetical protein
MTTDNIVHRQRLFTVKGGAPATAAAPGTDRGRL